MWSMTMNVTTSPGWARSTDNVASAINANVKYNLIGKMERKQA